MVCNRIPFGTMPAQVTPHPQPPFTLALTSGSENGSAAEAVWPGRSSEEQRYDAAKTEESLRTSGAGPASKGEVGPPANHA